MIAIIEYNSGNICSIQNALNRLGAKSTVTANPDEIMASEKVILPGVGEAKTAMRHLKEYGLADLIPELKVPVLGICLGLQLMCDSSEEGDTTCLGIFNTIVKRFPQKDLIPQMGWNNLSSFKGSLFLDFASSGDVYFVHEYYAELCDDTSAVCNYILPFSAALEKRNFYATQFHPEKSGDIGETIISNFLKL